MVEYTEEQTLEGLTKFMETEGVYGQASPEDMEVGSQSSAWLPCMIFDVVADFPSYLHCTPKAYSPCLRSFLLLSVHRL